MLVATASQRQVETTPLPTVTLGSREFDLSTAAILEAANIGNADGILGIDSLQDQRVAIDFESRRVLFELPDSADIGNRSLFP